MIEAGAANMCCIFLLAQNDLKENISDDFCQR